MSYITLTDYRANLQVSLGSRNYSNTLLDQWINFAYMDIVGGLDFEILNTESALSCTIGQAYVSVPDNTYIVKHVRDTTQDRMLTWASFSNLQRRPLTPVGSPIWWNFFGSKIYLRPVPSSADALVAYLRKSPTRFTTGTDKSVLPDEFDTLITMLANYYGFLLNNEESRAAYWIGLAINNLQSKLVPADIDPHGAAYLESLIQRQSILSESGLSLNNGAQQ